MNQVLGVPELGDLLSKIWQRVVATVNKLLETHKKYGYAQFEQELNPSLNELLEGFKHIDAALTTLMDTGALEYSEFRDAVNSKQCILKMKLLAGALDAKEQADYERLIAELEAQPQI